MPRHHTVRGAALTLGGLMPDALARVVWVRCRMGDYMLEEIFERMDGCDDASNDISDPDNCLSYGELKFKAVFSFSFKLPLLRTAQVPPRMPYHLHPSISAIYPMRVQAVCRP